MDIDFIDALVMRAREDSDKFAETVADLRDWRETAYQAIRAGAGKSMFEITSTSQHGKSVSGQITMSNNEVFSVLTNALDKLTNTRPALTFANLNSCYER